LIAPFEWIETVNHQSIQTFGCGCAALRFMFNHRLILNYKARLDQVDALTVFGRLMSSLDETGLTLPADIDIAEIVSIG